EEHATAEHLLRRLRSDEEPQWILLAGDDPAGWRALLELSGKEHHLEPVRVDATRLAGVDVLEIEECARRVGRLIRLTSAPLVIDFTQSDGSDAEDDGMGVFLPALMATGCRGALICRNEARIVRLLGVASYERATIPLPLTARRTAVRAAATGAEAYVTEEMAALVAAQYPLHVDGLAQAMRLARNLPLNFDTSDPRLDRFLLACKEVASEGICHLAERIEPIFSLDDVVLPADRKQQLIEIVNNVRFASTVFDGWKFREQLPYGRGVTAAFFGVSGTGK